MSKPAILLVGAGGHACACIDVIEQEGKFAIAGLVGLPDEVGMSRLGFPVLGTNADLPALVGEFTNALVTVGQIKDPEPRIRLFDLLVQIGFYLPVIISPRAYVSSHAQLGSGTIVMHGAVVNVGAKVGNNCILNSHSLVEHDVVIANHCHISTATALNGAVQIGTGTFIGSGTIVRELVRIGERCLIGMGQRVLADCPDNTFIPASKGLS